MPALVRLLIFAAAVLTVVYLCLSLYARSRRREALEAEWHQLRVGERDDYVRDGLVLYERQLRRNLVTGVYVVPLTLLTLLFWLAE